MRRIVAGVDGCPGGWLVVRHPADEPALAQATIVASFSDVLAMAPAADMIAVDMPIGLPASVGVGGRPCDVAARAVLGARQSAVFAVPARPAIACDDYAAACAAALRHSDPPRKVSKQTFNLFAKIREIDRLMTPALQQRVREVHPEVAFWALNGEQPVDLPKKVKSQPFAPGLALRRGLLDAAGYGAHVLDTVPGPRRLAGADDLLDACANAWSAVRLLQGTARVFPPDPERDEKGLLMTISG